MVTATTMNKQDSSTGEPDKKKRKLIVSEKDPGGPAKFDGSHFRKLIKGDNPLGALKQLLAVARNTSDEIISDYLQAGGSALEVILVIDKLEGKIYYQYQPVFSVLSLIITKCRDEFPRLEPSTEEACKRLLRHNNQAIHATLGPNSSHGQKKIALAMLTAMVTLSVQLAREVLSTLPLRELTMNDLAKHSIKYEPDCTRDNFIRYVLAYFYHDDTLLIRQLLDQRNLLQCIIFAGLTLDNAQLLVVLLTTLKEKIVDNLAINKTTKLKMFNTKIMMKLLEAYTWTGPAPQTGKKSKDNSLASDVTDCLHQLLVQLCTNHKLGVAFVDPTIGLGQKNYNELVFSVVKSMDPYWNICWVRDLALKIVTRCPDLVAPTFRHFGLQGFFQPEVTFSFVHTCEFAKQVIDSLSGDRNLLKTATADQLAHLTLRAVFNMNVLGCVKEGLQSVHPTLRLHAVHLLNSMFLALDRFLTTIKAWFSSSPKTFLDYQQKINDYISKNIALEQELMVCWSLGVGGDQSMLKVPTEAEYYLPLVDLLLSYTRVFPVYLPPVFVSKLQTTTIDTIDTQTKELFNVKVIKFITMFKNIQPSQVEFGKMLKTLVPLLSSHSEARSVLKCLLLQTGYFEGVEAEADIWVMNLSRFPNSEDHLPLLLVTLEQVVTKPKKCIRMIEESTVESLVLHSDEFNWNELIEVAKHPKTTLTPLQRMLPATRLSILVPALIRVLDFEDSSYLGSSRFVSHLFGDILFNQVEYGTFQQLIVKNCTSSTVQPIKEYITSIGSGTVLKQLFNKQSPEYRILKTLSLASFSDVDPLKTLGEVEPNTILLLVKLVVFFTVHVSDGNTVSRCTRTLQALLSRLANDCPLRQLALQEVLLHPLVLQGFHPLQAPAPDNLTSLVLAVVDICNSQDQTLLKPYRQRFLGDALKAVRKKKKVKSSATVNACSKLISGEEVVILLSAVVENQIELDQWADVAESLLQSAGALKCLLPEDVVTAISRYDLLHDTLIKYLDVFPHLIHYLDSDHLTSKQEELNKLCGLMLKFDSEGVVQKKLLKNNKKNPRVCFAALAAKGQLSFDSPVKHSSHLLRCVVEDLTSGSNSTWLSDSADIVGKFISHMSEDEREEVFSVLNGELSWTEVHLDIARHVYLRLGRVVDLVIKTLRLLVSHTVPDKLDRAKSICLKLRESLMNASHKKHEQDWEHVKTSDEWSQWARLALKLGETPDPDASFLLTTLSTLCATVYSQDRQGTKGLTEMLLSHSQFLTVMLAKPTPTKTALLELLLTLLQLDASMMASTHIPILLAAYSASLSASDQLILQLLQLYESHGIILMEWKPFLWGDTAASFYSVRGTIAPGLWNKQNFTQLMDLFDEHRVNITVANFPIYRELRPKNKMDEHPDVYDPAFYLPMLVAMFAPSEIFYTYKTCQSGCLSLILAALASHYQDVRTIAYVALQRFHCHLISNTKTQDTLWLHFLDALRRGLRCESGAGVPRLSSIVTVFLARCVLALTSPLNPLYLPLSQFLLAKPTFDLDTTPELLPLFNSFSLEHHSAHQGWILTVLRDGMRDDEDFNICLNSMVFKIILDYYSCTLASDKTKVLIIEVLGAAVKLKSGRNLLVNGYSLYPWLATVVRQSGLSSVFLSPLISVLADLLHKSSAAQVIPLLVHLTAHSQLTEPQLAAVLAALAPHSLSADTVRHLVDVVDTKVGQVFQHRTMLDNGVKYVKLSSNSSKDVREFLKEIVFRLFESES